LRVEKFSEEALRIHGEVSGIVRRINGEVSGMVRRLEGLIER